MPYRSESSAFARRVVAAVQNSRRPCPSLDEPRHPVGLQDSPPNLGLPVPVTVAVLGVEPARRRAAGAVELRFKAGQFSGSERCVELHRSLPSLLDRQWQSASSGSLTVREKSAKHRSDTVNDEQRRTMFLQLSGGAGSVTSTAASVSLDPLQRVISGCCPRSGGFAKITVRTESASPLDHGLRCRSGTVLRTREPVRVGPERGVR
jgi:hypothetical protein